MDITDTMGMAITAVLRQPQVIHQQPRQLRLSIQFQLIYRLLIHLQLIHHRQIQLLTPKSRLILRLWLMMERNLVMAITMTIVASKVVSHRHHHNYKAHQRRNKDKAVTVASTTTVVGMVHGVVNLDRMTYSIICS